MLVKHLVRVTDTDKQTDRHSQLFLETLYLWSANLDKPYNASLTIKNIVLKRTNLDGLGMWRVWGT